MSVEERLVRYCKIDTQSDPTNGAVSPSTQKQFDLANVLVKELKEIGLEDVYVDDKCYVYGWLPANVDKDIATVGFIAHMDTAPDFSGKDVNPQIIPCFDGEDIPLNKDVVLKMEDFPQMRSLKGKRLIVTDGNTLLGADDKAGIAAIMEALVYLQAHPEVEHGRIAIGFTPDEEIGSGAQYLDVEKFGAAYAYTMDGGTVAELSDETFNAASACVHFKGFSIHPGSAKNKMINASALACEYQSLLPEYLTPEHTEGREGFIHLTDMHGDVENATLEYIIRDHDRAKLAQWKKRMQTTAEYMNTLYGEGTVKVSLTDGYHNMKEVLEKHPEAVTIAYDSMEELGIKPLNEPVRGGTDGAELSFRGLPCPNLGNGGGNFHGRYEYCVVEELEKAVEVILKIVEKTTLEATK